MNIWFDTFKATCKDEIIQQWLQKVEEKYPGYYEHAELTQNASNYYDLLLDIEQPLENHPNYSIITGMRQFLAEHLIPLHHVFYSAHIWRESIFYSMGEFIIKNDIKPKELFAILPFLHERSDSIQENICTFYWEHSMNLVRERERTIDELHQDRLSLLGQMAASMAHELKNPLFAIEGFLKLIKAELKTDSTERVNRYIDVIEAEFHGLYGQISGFLSFSKNEGTDEPFALCSVTDFINSAVSLFKARLLSENINIEININTTYIMKIQKTALQQVLSNLLSNSIDALNGCAAPKLIQIHSWEDDTNLYISVMDNGPGIPEELQNKIFEPFVTTKPVGTGLGLSICKQILDKNAGTISFTSKEKETVFTVSFVKSSDLQKRYL